MKISVNLDFSGVVGSKEYFSLWQIFKCGGIGSKRKIFSRKRAEKPLLFVSLAGKKKVVPPAGKKAPLWCHSSRKEAAGRNKPPLFQRVVCEKRRRVGKIPASGTKGIESSPIPRSPAVSKSKFLPQCQNSLIAPFAPAGNLLGSAFPKPCLCGLRRLSPPQPCGNRKEVIPCERDTTRPTAAAL